MLKFVSILWLLPLTLLFAGGMPTEKRINLTQPGELLCKDKLDSLPSTIHRFSLRRRFKEARNEFERRMGLLPAPKAGDVELNDMTLGADPTVDLKVIYPRATRDKIVKKKWQKWQRPPRWHFRK